MASMRIIPILLALSIVIAGCGVDTCRNEASRAIEGYVEDRDGNPLQGITIYGFADPPEGIIPPQPTCSTQTSASGTYLITLQYGVKVLIALPAGQGWVFAPESRFWHHGDSLEGYDFKAYRGPGYMVDGHVWGREGPGQPYPGISVEIRSDDGSRRDVTATDGEGYYVFHELYPVFDYEITPLSYCPESEPSSRTLQHPDEDYHDRDFTMVTPQFVYIRGCVTDPYGNPLEGVTIEFSYTVPYPLDADDVDPRMATTQFEVTTDADGRYSIHTMSCIYIEVRPSEPGCFAVPYMRSYGPRNDIDGEDYTLFCGEGYTISGYLRDQHGEPVPDTDVEISAQDFGWHEVRSDTAGYYEFTNLPWGLDYEVEPEPHPGYCTCVPARREYQDLDGDYSDQDFVITCSP